MTVNAVAPGFVAGNMASEWQEDELQAMITELPQQRLVYRVKLLIHAPIYITQMLEVLLELYRKLMVLGIFKI